ncbi:ATP-dependent DNA helicase Q5 [Vanrija pseudolonga]|uniref:ATP-dependent DNA helicase n=1 Tax=Vanrija pseudolonga TaxID=143232 RepID=A0AAF0YI14_9TREE|nr:ATP-dependent DNA helicase Q5 [Vanrija pseudolonga]
MEDDGEVSVSAVFPLPSATPAPTSTYPCQVGSQYEANNFKPRKFSRVPSATESHAALRRTLQKYWGHSDFRGPQLEICAYALRGCDLLVVAPTGLGKSVCFQVPAVTIEYGITIVVSPLLALMRDQVSSLQQKGIDAVQLNEKTSMEDVKEVKRQLSMGHPRLRLLYVTPETLFSAKYQAEFDLAYHQRQIVRLVVDEAHVIDEWGSSFRPTYRRLGEFRLRYPTVPITALTASATSAVRKDLLTILNMPQTQEQGLAQWVEPFNRKNLFYEIRYYGGGGNGNKFNLIAADLSKLILGFVPEAKSINDRHRVTMPCISGLVYCRYTADCEDIAAHLNERGIKAKPFYASLPLSKREETLDDWKAGKVECIVATIAFGMGVDQAHVRYVVHYDMPKSFEGYYQETGRAGRDGHMSRCVLYYSREDASRLRGLIDSEASRSKRDGHDQMTVDRNKLRMVNSFKALQMYAEATGLCRHIAICRYFGERLDDVTPEIKAKYCNGLCDVCANRASVFQRSWCLTESIDVASPIVAPAPLEAPVSSLSLDTARHNTLAAWHGPTAQPTVGPPPADSSVDLPVDHDAMEQLWMMDEPQSSFLATTETPCPRSRRVGLRPMAAPANLVNQVPTPSRVQTIDQVAENGLSGAIAVYGEQRSPGHAERKRKERERTFKGVKPATPGGPSSFYNVSAPPKRAKVASDFKVPSMTPRVPAGQGHGQELDRTLGLQKLQEALKASFAEGTLADQVLAYWGREETGERRIKLIRKVARELEVGLAKGATEAIYVARLDETCESLKLVRARRGVQLLVEDKLATSSDARVERLRRIEACFRAI